MSDRMKISVHAHSLKMNTIYRWSHFQCAWIKLDGRAFCSSVLRNWRPYTIRGDVHSWPILIWICSLTVTSRYFVDVFTLNLAQFWTAMTQMCHTFYPRIQHCEILVTSLHEVTSCWVFSKNKLSKANTLNLFRIYVLVEEVCNDTEEKSRGYDFFFFCRD